MDRFDVIESGEGAGEVCHSEDGWLVQYQALLEENELLKGQMADTVNLLRAVAHVGVNTGYGVFDLKSIHIQEARELLETYDEH